MRINNISAKSAFGRVIPVNSISNPARKSVPVDESTFEISRILNGEETSRYSKNEAKRIRKFFKKALGDYDYESGAVMRKIGKDVFILSGKDAVEYRNYIKLQTSKAKQISGKAKKELLCTAHKKADRRILKKAENGENGKPNSTFEFKSFYINKDKLTLEQFVGIEPIDVYFNKISYKTDKPFDNGNSVHSANRYLEILV